MTSKTTVNCSNQDQITNFFLNGGMIIIAIVQKVTRSNLHKYIFFHWLLPKQVETNLCIIVNSYQSGGQLRIR